MCVCLCTRPSVAGWGQTQQPAVSVRNRNHHFLLSLLPSPTTKQHGDFELLPEGKPGSSEPASESWQSNSSSRTHCPSPQRDTSCEILAMTGTSLGCAGLGPGSLGHSRTAVKTRRWMGWMVKGSGKQQGEDWDFWRAPEAHCKGLPGSHGKIHDAPELPLKLLAKCPQHRSLGLCMSPAGAVCWQGTQEFG